MSHCTEADVWRQIKRSAPGMWERLESFTGQGHPDTYYAHAPYTGWCELKAVKRVGLVNVDEEPLPIHIRGAQLVWHDKYRRHGGISWVLAGQRLTRAGSNARWAFYVVPSKELLGVHQGCVVTSIRVYIDTLPWDELLRWVHDVVPPTL